MRLMELLVAVVLLDIVALLVTKFFDIINLQNFYWNQQSNLNLFKMELTSTLGCNSVFKANQGPDAGVVLQACDFDPGRDFAGCPLPQRSVEIYKGATDRKGILVKMYDTSQSEALPGTPRRGYERFFQMRANSTCCSVCANGKGIMVEYPLRNTRTQDPWRNLFSSYPTTASVKGIPLACVVP